MSYNTIVDQFRHKELNKRAREFATNYDPSLPSVVLLPGGMGSSLLQSEVAYQPGQPFPTNPPFSELWLDFIRAIFGDMKDLTMSPHGEDKAFKPIISSGELSSIVKKYEGIEEFFQGKANYIGFGYDWRRPPDKEFMYVRAFLKQIRSRVKKKGHPDPLPNLTLYAHSQGGLVAKFFMNDIIERGESTKDWFKRCVTCATPFYGTYSHLSRFYVGVSILNTFTGGAKKVSQIVASLKGPFILLIAPESVLKPRYAALGLDRYPIRDKKNKNKSVDIFSSLVSVKKRLPKYIENDFLTSARNAYSHIDTELPANVKTQVFHIRSNINESGSNAFESYWKNVNGETFDPSEGDPISDNGSSTGMHDGTVPFWSARLATTPDSNVYNFSGIEHAGAAEHPDILKLVWELVRGQTPAGGEKPCGPDFTYGPKAKVRKLAKDIQQHTQPEDALDQLTADDRRTLLKEFTLA